MMRFKSYNRPPKGSTLLEIIIFTAIGSMLLIAVSGIFVSGLNIRTVIDAQQKLVNTSRFINLTVESYLTSVNNVTVPAVGTDTTLTVHDPISGNNITFSHNDVDLMMQVGAAQAVELNGSRVRVTSFSVTRIVGAPDAIKIDISFETTSARGNIISYSTSYSHTLRYE